MISIMYLTLICTINSIKNVKNDFMSKQKGNWCHFISFLGFPSTISNLGFPFLI